MPFPQLPPGWTVTRTLETVPNPNAGSAPGGQPGFVRWTYIATDQNGQFVAASGDETDAYIQARAVIESRRQQLPYV